MFYQMLLDSPCLEKFQNEMQVNSLQKELESEKSWGKHVKKLIDKVSVCGRL